METKSGVRFTVYGEPQGKARARTVRNTQTGRTMTYTPDKTAIYENLIALEYQAQCRGHFFPRGTAVAVQIDCYMKPPKGKRPGRPMKKPDADNVAKVAADALNGVAWYDDTQITDLEVHKYWATEQPCVEITIEEAMGNDAE